MDTLSIQYCSEYAHLDISNFRRSCLEVQLRQNTTYPVMCLVSSRAWRLTFHLIWTEGKGSWIKVAIWHARQKRCSRGGRRGQRVQKWWSDMYHEVIVGAGVVHPAVSWTDICYHSVTGGCSPFLYSGWNYLALVYSICSGYFQLQVRCVLSDYLVFCCCCFL